MNQPGQVVAREEEWLDRENANPRQPTPSVVLPRAVLPN